MATILVTGANRGIGLEFCRLYKARGDEVIAVCRNNSDELEQLGIEVIDSIDVSEASCMDEIRLALKGRVIDLLVNNAGILVGQNLDTLKFDDVSRQFEVNAMGPLRVVHALLDNFSEGSKVALITSRMGSMGDNGSGGQYGYRMSKAALNAAGVSLAHDLKGQGVSVAILHPGYVQTGMVGFRGDVPASESAANICQRIDELNIENTGTFWHANGDVLPW